MNAYPEILTMEQAAAYLQVSTRTLQRMVTAGRVPGRQVGSQWRFERDQLREWVRGEEPSPAEKEQAAQTLSQRELVTKESLRLGVDVPETLLDMQQSYAERRGRGSQSADTATDDPDEADR